MPSTASSQELPVSVRNAHDEAVARGDAGYRDPATGFFVFTAQALRARGWCCGNGCRHCPYCPYPTV